MAIYNIRLILAFSQHNLSLCGGQRPSFHLGNGVFSPVLGPLAKFPGLRPLHRGGGIQTHFPVYFSMMLLGYHLYFVFTITPLQLAPTHTQLHPPLKEVGYILSKDSHCTRILVFNSFSVALRSNCLFKFDFQR